jgi:hypothetical protein
VRFERKNALQPVCLIKTGADRSRNAYLTLRRKKNMSLVGFDAGNQEEKQQKNKTKKKKKKEER